MYDSSIFFRQPVEGGTQPNRSLVPLAFDQWRVPFIGDWKLRQREKVERKEPRRGTFSPPPGARREWLAPPLIAQVRQATGACQDALKLLALMTLLSAIVPLLLHPPALRRKPPARESDPESVRQRIAS